MTEQKSPTGIDIRRDAIEIDAVIVAEGLGIVASHVPILMRNGEITSLCERGTGQDTGRHRLTWGRRRAVGLEPLAERLAKGERVPQPKDREAYERGYEAWLRQVGWRR